MPFWRLYYHLVWATRKRAALITPDIESGLYRCLSDKASELETVVYALNGWVDHVHLLVAIPPKHAVSDVVRQLKGASSHYANQHLGLDTTFAWQQGYGALSVGERQLPIAVTYIARQKQHHAAGTINAWLERDAGLDEGPAATVMGQASAVHEARVPYVEDDIPF